MLSEGLLRLRTQITNTSLEPLVALSLGCLLSQKLNLANAEEPSPLLLLHLGQRETKPSSESWSSIPEHKGSWALRSDISLEEGRRAVGEGKE